MVKQSTGKKVKEWSIAKTQLSFALLKRVLLNAQFPWVRFSLFLLVCFIICFPFTKTGKDAVRAIGRTKLGKEVLRSNSPIEEDEAELARLSLRKIEKDSDVAESLSGFRLNYAAHFYSGESASRERESEGSYDADFKLNIKFPTAATGMYQLTAANPNLPKMLPGLVKMMNRVTVSPFFIKLYNNKAERIKKKVTKLGEALTKHNFYDCDTMLELTDPETKRKVFFIQADMDVVSDGSDGDRLAKMPKKVVNSSYYQPFTTYGWKKKTSVPNPMEAGWKKRLYQAEWKLKKKNLSSKQRGWLRYQVKKIKLGLIDMQRRSFLVAEHDPFVVISIELLRKASDGGFVPQLGDYVVVIYEDKAYPAIVGDGGPAHKAGEASLRLAREIDANATPYRRPVSDLAVSYIVFPGTAEEERSAPNYKKWHKRCSELLNEIGGLASGYKLHKWKNTFPPQVTRKSRKKGI